MQRRQFTQAALAAGALGPLGLAHAQTVTGAPSRITSAFPVGSGPDVVARLVAEKLATRWKQAVIVDAKPGGAGVLAINTMKNLAPTGNELVLADVGNLSINPLIFRKLPYDPEKELVPVALNFMTHFFVIVGANSRFKTIKDLMDGAKGATLTYGSNAVGGPIHLGSAQLEAALGATMTHVPYKETSQLYAAVSTGEVDWAFGSIATALSLLKAGKVRFLAIAHRQRSPALPEVPTLEEAGGPKGVEASAWNAYLAPAGTPATVVAEINKSINEALAQPDVKERMSTFSFVANPLSPQQVGELMRSERAKYAEVVKRVKVSID